MTDAATQTRCPACQTVFAVEAADLERAGGRVRCGDCMQLFDARAHAIEGPEAATDGGHAGGDGEESRAAAGHDTAATAGGPAADDASDAEGAEPEIDDDGAEEIDDSPFTATNWFIVDEAGDLAPMDGATNDEAAQDDVAPDVEDSGAFRFGDDTPPDTLRAELAALVGDEVDDADEADAPQAGVTAPTSPATEPPRGEDEAPAAEIARDVMAPDRDPLAGSAAAGGEPPESPRDQTDAQDDDWDDLLGELDEEFDARFDALQADETPGPETVLEEATAEAELELDSGTEPESEPEPAEAAREPEHGPADLDAPSLGDARAGAPESDPSAPLDFELVETDEAGSETSLDLDLTRATGEGRSPDFELVDDELPASDIAPAELDMAREGAGAAAPDTGREAAEPEQGEDAPAAPAEDTDAQPADASGDGEDFNAAALDDMMDALRLLDEEPAPGEDDGATDDGDSQGDGAEAATRAEDGAADAGGDEAQTDGEAEPEPRAEAGEPQAADDDTGKTTVGEDTINAMAEGARGEVIVLGSEAEAEAPQAAGVALAAENGAADDDPSFAESMIVSPELAPKPRRTGLWLTLSAIAALGLLVQAVHTWRGTLATMPFWQDALPRVYGMIGVTLTPEWDIRPWCVETSGALASETGLDIEAIFSNRGDTALPPPELKVRIVDAYSNTLAATVISPADYLADAGAPTRVAPGGRITALARLDYSEPRLDGYEVALCYANADGTLRCGTGCNDGD